MFHSPLDNTFVERLKDILSSRYGKGLQIRQLTNLNDVDPDISQFKKGHDLHIPLRLKGAFLGTAVVPAVDDLNEEKQSGIAQLVRMILEPAMYDWYLSQKENNLQEISKAQMNLDNVHLFGEVPGEESAMPVVPPVRELVSHLVHLNGRSENANKKIALQLHDMTSRWAFVPFNDIKNQLHSAEDICHLGEMSIFIERIEDLNEAEQELILDYLQIHHEPDDPLIITSSHLTLRELEHFENLKPHLRDEVSVNCFEVDRAPMEAHRLVEVLELFFLKDPSRPS